jgi:hypothetical protein
MFRSLKIPNKYVCITCAIMERDEFEKGRGSLSLPVHKCWECREFEFIRTNVSTTSHAPIITRILFNHHYSSGYF